ncbi:hypothetical protein AQ436_12085 [Arthrobacter sp. EpRS66]|nr:hypothetical protein AQ436_12085 [Arthrobacter sp. EpRS66]
MLAQSTQMLFPVETVHMVIEVKTTLNANEVEDVAVKVEQLRLLRSSNLNYPKFALFAYDVAGSLAARAAEMDRLTEEKKADVICVLHPGLITDPGNPHRLGFVPLHEVDTDGNRISNVWQRTEDRKWVIKGSTRYPVGRFRPNARERYVFEPGRTLLLFAARLLDFLTPQGSAWLGNYLTNTAREVVPVSSIEP